MASVPNGGELGESMRQPTIWILFAWLFLADSLSAASCGASGAAAATPPSTAAASQWVTPAVTGPGLGQRIFRSPTVAADVSYHVFLPAAYHAEPARRFPVLYWLHGTGGGIARVAAIAARFDVAMRAGEIPPMIVVFPHGLPAGMWMDSKDGSTPIESILIKDLIPHLDACLRTIASREGRLLEGFSMGGYGVARLGFRYPQTFAGVLMLAAGPLQPELWSTPRASAESRARLMNRVYGDDMGFFREQSPWNLAEQAAKSGTRLPRLRQVVGTDDDTHPANLEFHRHLSKLGIEHEYIELPGVGHALPGIWASLGGDFRTFYTQTLQQ